MKTIRNAFLAITLTLIGVLSMTTPTAVQAQLPTQPPTQQPPTPPITGVFVILTPSSAATVEKIMAIMPAEIRATTQLYQDGKIREWYSRGDGRGVIFLLNTTDVAQAHTIMDGLPLGKTNLMDHEYIPVGPLVPLRLLLANPAPKQ
jgi:hypothetical protein